MKRLRTPLILTVALLVMAALVPAAAQARASGDQVWHRTVVGLKYGFDAIAPCPGGVYVIGTRETASGPKLWFGKYSGSHKLLWSKTSHLGTATCLTVTSAGNLLVGGEWPAAGQGVNVVVVKYSAAGKHLWTATYDGKAHDTDHVTALAVDPDGNVLATGSTTTSAARGVDAMPLTLRDNNGARLWRFAFDGQDNGGFDESNDLAVNKSGTTFFTGDTQSGGHVNTSALTVKVSKTGKMLWYSKLGIEGQAVGRRIGIVLSNDCVIAGETDGVNKDIFVAKLASMTGHTKWAPVTYDFGAPDYLHDMAIGRYGDIFCVGDTGFSPDALVVAWRYNGAPYFHTLLTPGPGELSSFSSIALSPGDAIYAAGWLDDPFDEMVVTKYSWNGSTFQWRWNSMIASGGGGETRAKGVTWLKGTNSGVYAAGIWTPPSGQKAVVERVKP
jgi:hypothetical protein